MRALATAGVFPEGDWTWQLAPVEAVCRELVSLLETGPSRDRPVRHLSMEPLEIRPGPGRAAQPWNRTRPPAGAGAGQRPDRRGPACESNRGARADDPGYRAVCAAAQLVLQYGPHAALNLSDAQLLTPNPIPGDPDAIFSQALGNFYGRHPASLGTR